jgi:hypothetical protein
MITVMTGCLLWMRTRSAKMHGESQFYVPQDAIPPRPERRQRVEQSKAGDGVCSAMTEVRICPFTH